MTATIDPAPHTNLYTRLQSSPGRGIGVFAIRRIPQGTNPFAGDLGPKVLFPLSEFEKIHDPEVRRMYVDFCPLVDRAFVAPSDLNQLTLSWYMNHSGVPNVSSFRDSDFAALRDIRKGEELTIDYTLFSDHAEQYVRDWGTRP